MKRQVKIFATTGSEYLVDKICESLQKRLPKSFQPNEKITRSNHVVKVFSNGNMEVEVENVRGFFVIVVHTQVIQGLHDKLFELFLMLDAIYNSKPEDVLVIFPYMPYARSDRKNKPRISVGGKVILKIIERVLKVKNVMLLDPHAPHMKHYIDPAADEITAINLIAENLQENFLNNPAIRNRCTFVFPDAGAAKRFEELPITLRLPIAYIDKGRPHDDENPSVKKIVGDIKGRICFLLDDEILTGSTIIKDVAMLEEEGAEEIYVIAIHPIFNDKGSSGEEVIRKLENSNIKRIIVTDSVPVAEKIKPGSNIVILESAHLIAEAIKRVVLDESISELHLPGSIKEFGL
jgi:ribose-phosphate pyrophosphokinase